MKKHVHNTQSVPLLIFPEGTCVNNEYTVLFQKGAFALDAHVVPCAIKYDKSWADAYWHSKSQSFVGHLLYLMTRWSLVAEVWYLEPQSLTKGQSPIDFANSVKALISKQANLKNLSWDGYFKVLKFADIKRKN
jgi:glycerol-3-phosphate O-acyltransferase 3/4